MSQIKEEAERMTNSFLQTLSSEREDGEPPPSGLFLFLYFFFVLFFWVF